jgi:hypothetical protein
MLAEAEAGPPANQPLTSQPEVDLSTTASPSPSSFDAATITLEIQAPPEHPGVPHRFNDPSRSQHAFPHAIVASKQREGEHEYQLDITRQATLSLKFNALPEGYPITEMWLDLMLKPSLEIEDNGHWRLATTADFPGRKVHPITKTPPLFHEPIWAFPSPLELTVHLQLDVLSSQTYPAHKRLRFKFQGSLKEEHLILSTLPEQPCTGSVHVEACSVPFVSVAKTISSKKAGKERANPPPLTETAQTTKEKREASARAAQAVHEKRFATVADALADAEFEGATRRVVDKALQGLQQAVGTSSEQIEASDGEESEGEESDGEEDEHEYAEEDEHEYAEEESDADPTPQQEPSVPVQPSSEKLSEIRSESINLLGSNGRRERRKQTVDLLLTEAVAVQQGLEGNGVDLRKVEEARLAYKTEGFGAVDSALDSALQEYLAVVHAHVEKHVEVGGILSQQPANTAAATLKSRLYDSTLKTDLKQKVANIEGSIKIVNEIDPMSQERADFKAAQRSKLDEELATTESKLKRLSAPGSLQSLLSCASQCIKNAITLVKDPPVDICKGRMLLDKCGVFSETTDVIQHALRATSAPVLTNAHWRSFQFRAKRVYNDMAKDQSDFEPTRCDASFMTGTLDKEDIDALQQAVAFLRKLADGCKSASEMPLVTSLVPVDAPLDSVAFAQAQPVDASKHSLIYLPPIDVIDNSSASALLIPKALFRLPAEYVLRFVAENTPLPPTPRGSKILAQRALPDVLRLLDGFVAERGEKTTFCPFRAHGEMDGASLQRLKFNVKAAARLLRGETVEEEAAAPASADTQAASHGKITYNEDKSGVFHNEDETVFCARITYTVTFNGKEYESTLDNHHQQLSLGHAPSEEECHSWFNDNQCAAYDQARTELWKKKTEAKNRAQSEQAKAQHDRWEAMRRKLDAKATQAGGDDNVELAALRNAARALVNCGVDGYEGGLRGGSSHSRDSKRSEKRYYEDVRSAPIQSHIQLSKEAVQGASTEMKIEQSKAMAVLNTIAAKAHLNVAHIPKNVKKMEGSKAKGPLTTKRHRVIKISSFDHLMKVANVVSDAINLFMDKTRSKEQKAWLVKRECRKRKRA